MRGGPSHIDMWDPKPDAPVELRGEFGVIDTNVPGIRLSDMLPLSAKIMDKWSIVRSLHHHDAGHCTGDQICFTGYNAGPDPDENVHPSLGSIVSKQLGHLSTAMPAYVMIPRMVPGAGPAYLGVAHKPFETQADPAQPGPFKLPNFKLAGRRDVRPGRRPQGAAEAVRHAPPRRRQDRAGGRGRPVPEAGVGHPHVAGGPRRVRPRPRAAKVRERYGFMPAFDPKAADRCGAPNWASGCCWRGGWSKRACGS